MSSDYAATMPFAIRRAEEARRASPTPAEMLQDEAPMFPTTPVYARQRKSSGLAGVSPVALIGGGTVLVAAAAIVFALSWGGGSDEVQVASTPIDQPPAVAPVTPEQPAVNDPSQMAEATAAAPEQAQTQPIERAAMPAPAPDAAKSQRVARVRPAPAAPSATDTAEDASAMLPDGPMPYVPDGQPTQPMTSPSAAPSVSATTPPPVIVPQTSEPPAATAAPPIDAAPNTTPDAAATAPATAPMP